MKRATNFKAYISLFWSAIYIFFAIIGNSSVAQSIYYAGGDEDWETVDPASVGWDVDKLDRNQLLVKLSLT